MKKKNTDKLINRRWVSILFAAVVVILAAGCDQIVFDNPFKAGEDLELNTPATPDGLSVSAADSTLKISWNSIIGADHYDLYYSRTSDISEAAPVPGGSVTRSTYTLTDLANENLYYIWIRSVNNAGTSAWSSAVLGTPTVYTQAPSTVTGLTLIEVDGGLYMLWDTAERAVYYEVWYSAGTDRAAAELYLDSDPEDTYCGLDGLTNETSYTVWVRAVNGFASGDFSTPKSGSPMAHSSGLTITAGDNDFNYNKTNTLNLVLDFTEAIANSTDLATSDFIVTGQNGESYPVTGLTWNSSLNRVTLSLDVSDVARSGVESWSVSLENTLPLNQYSQIPWLYGSDLEFEVSIRSIDPPSGLDNSDIILRKIDRSGSAFYYSGAYSPDSYTLSELNTFTFNSMHLKVDPRSHSETENFTLHYTLDNGANWTPLTAGEAVIPLPSRNVQLDVEYIYDLDSSVKSNGFTALEIPVDYTVPEFTLNQTIIQISQDEANIVFSPVINFSEHIDNYGDLVSTDINLDIQTSSLDHEISVNGFSWDDSDPDNVTDLTIDLRIISPLSTGSADITLDITGFDPEDRAGLKPETGLIAEFTLEVVEAQVQSLSIATTAQLNYLSNKTGSELSRAEISVSPFPFFADGAVSWSVDNENIATITQNGVLTAVEGAEGSITVTATSINTPSVTKSITFEVMTPFVTVWSLPAEANLILPLVSSGQYNFIVDWGGYAGQNGPRIQSIQTNTARYLYSNAAIDGITVEIIGVIKGWSFGMIDGADNNYENTLIEIQSWGPLAFSNGDNSTHSQFANCGNLQEISAVDLPDMEGTTNMNSFFKYNTSLSYVNRINEWDVSRVENMTSLFQRARLFNQDISGWETGSVGNMTQMFYFAEAFNYDISGWDVSNVPFDKRYLFNAESPLDSEYLPHFQ